MFLAFDYPIPFTTIGRRSVSNVPAQALTMLNNPFVTEQAQVWGTRVAGLAGQSQQQRIEGIYRAALSRDPRPDELVSASDFLGTAALDDAGAWSELCHVVLNLKEFVFLR